MHHPWKQLGELADWDLVWAPLQPGRRGACHWPTRTLTLAPGLLQAERRSVLAHELEHVARGPAPLWAMALEEEAVNAAAARKLIKLQDLGEALAWSHDPAEIADELWVDVPTLRARLRHLHPAERAYLRQRLDLSDEATAASAAT